jgi:phosphonate transport system substrate-binding protein
MISIKNNIIFYKIVFPVLIISSGSVKASCLGDTAVKPIKAYIVPQLIASQTYTQWAPVLDRVGKSAELCFDLIVPATIPQFETDLANGRPDFVFMNPYHVVMKWREHQYVPLVASSEPIFGVLTVKKDSKYASLQDLSNVKIAFPAPNAFAASLLIRSLLTNNGVRFEPVYVKTHSNVYRSVVRGDIAVAGGGIESTLLAEPTELKDELRVLVETKRYTSHPFSANARIPKQIQERVQTAFLNMAKTVEGAELLSRIQMAKPMAVSYKANYQALEALRLNRFVVRSAE